MDIYTKIPMYTLAAGVLFLLWRLLRTPGGGGRVPNPHRFQGLRAFGRGLLGGLLRALRHWQALLVIVGTLIAGWCFTKAGMIDVPAMEFVPKTLKYTVAGAAILIISVVIALNFQDKQGIRNDEDINDDGGGKKHQKEPNSRFVKLGLALVVAGLVLAFGHIYQEVNQEAQSGDGLYTVVVIAVCFLVVTLDDKVTKVLYLAVVLAIATAFHFHPILDVLDGLGSGPPSIRHRKVAAFVDDVHADVEADRSGFALAIQSLAHIAQANRWEKHPEALQCETVFRWLVEDGAGYTITVDAGVRHVNWCGLLCSLGMQIDDLGLPTDFPGLRDPKVINEARTTLIRKLLENSMDNVVKVLNDPWAMTSCEPEPERLG